VRESFETIIHSHFVPPKSVCFNPSLPFFPFPLPFSISLLLVKGSIPTGGAGGLPHLQHPAGHREVVETVILLLTSRVGIRFSKVRVPGDDGEVLVSASSWNKSSLALPCPVGVLLRCRR
jgi:hypothetical protein